MRRVEYIVNEKGQFTTRGLGAFTLEECGHSERLLELAAWAAARFDLGADFVEAALREIERGAGTRFDPEVAGAFLRYEREERWAVC